MRRSLLFIPANSPAMIQNADIFYADSVIFDLEDAVIYFEKDAALNLVNHYLKQFKIQNIEVIIRINDILSKQGEIDLSSLDLNEIDTIMLPKASKKSMKVIDQLLSSFEETRKISKKLNVIPIIESASSLIEVNEIAAFKRVNGLLLGAEDLATDLEVERSLKGDEIFLARSLVVLAAKAYKIDAIDTPFTKTSDRDGLLFDATFAKSLGMNAKACIHPNQIEDINHIFSPSIKELNEAKKILIAYEQSLNDKKGAFSVDGKMIDKPIIERAKKMIDKAKHWHLL